MEAILAGEVAVKNSEGELGSTGRKDEKRGGKVFLSPQLIG